MPIITKKIKNITQHPVSQQLLASRSVSILHFQASHSSQVKLKLSFESFSIFDVRLLMTITSSVKKLATFNHSFMTKFVDTWLKSVI